MNAQEMWTLYSEKHGVDAEFQAWSFGVEPDKLAQLVMTGIKTGTTSAYIWYKLENLDLPRVGDYSVVLNVTDDAICIIQTTKVYIVPFDEVSEYHAHKEGEGDRSLTYWRKVHEAYFKEEFESAGLTFNGQTKVVCEEFIRVFP